MQSFKCIVSYCVVSLLVCSSQLSAQGDVPPPGFHTHDGFYLSMSIGPAFGPINMEAQNASFNKKEISGKGGLFDFKIGGAIAEGLILSFDIMVRSIVAPNVTEDGVTYGTSSDYSASDALLGVGVTKYFMPSNIFVCGTIGMGSFIVENSMIGIRAESKKGFSYQIKIGKEWWVSQEWALGVSAGIAVIAADAQTVSGSNCSGKLSTTRFFVLFNTTFN